MARVITARRRRIRGDLFCHQSIIELSFLGPSINIKSPDTNMRMPKVTITHGMAHSRAASKKTIAKTNLISPTRYIRLPRLKNSIMLLITPGFTKYTIARKMKSMPKILITMLTIRLLEVRLVISF